MPYSRWFAVVVVVAAVAGPTPASPLDPLRVGTRERIERLNTTLAGKVIDHTNNHRVDRRICSPALGEKRDLYVYTPPGYDGVTPFPFMMWLHGLGQDEKNFLDIIPLLDDAIRCGRLPPLVIAAPDGTINGKPTVLNGGSFYLNSDSGRYADYVMDDVWGFVFRHYCLRPERGAHVMAGASMGGFGAYNLGFKHRDRVGVLVGLIPPLDTRYVSCTGRYLDKYDPTCVGVRDTTRPNLPIARFYGLLTVREKHLTGPLVGSRSPDAMERISRDNPREMLAAHDVRPGEFAMYVGYAGKDEFNLDSQAKHFLDDAVARGLTVTVQEVPDGRHCTSTCVRMFPSVATFLHQHVSPYAPPPTGPAPVAPLAP